ncbi:KinB-signaling pathway activation protein [Paenibacillus validus]|uniref:KinB signaling pathway activation protein n=1 Tax=Paenibacillus validus TaxID=44253 RepID=A0A7X2ZEP8_9BACL|nr:MULTISPECIES: KinB-signaling pathway activation protein [Paenibacillus]MED4600323.1 KinB-signaling pathway activation protein [Paenibacillus validus]MED4605984.1 KinB-signaling pathway activation protein [Paenibacillus validus]MUG73474.1 KinB signaling pathway activation protein [Paenibacillus validus]
MTIRKWFYLFWTTLVVGVVVGTLTGLTMQLTDQEAVLSGKSISHTLIVSLLVSATFSVLSQMGFFAYLIVRYIFMGMMPKKWIWDYLQIILIVIVLIDLVYLRYTSAEGEVSFVPYLWLPLFITVVSFVVAWFKVRWTNPSAWIPTLFFMIVVTALEALPAIREDDAASTIFMIIPLLACNAWQILILQKVLQTSKEPQ